MCTRHLYTLERVDVTSGSIVNGTGSDVNESAMAFRIPQTADENLHIALTLGCGGMDFHRRVLLAPRFRPSPEPESYLRIKT
jgi:hypothetical protein